MEGRNQNLAKLIGKRTRQTGRSLINKESSQSPASLEVYSNLMDKQQQQPRPPDTNILQILKGFPKTQKASQPGRAGDNDKQKLMDDQSEVEVSPSTQLKSGPQVEGDAVQELYDSALSYSTELFGSEIANHLKETFTEEIFNPFVHDSGRVRVTPELLPPLVASEYDSGASFKKYGTFGDWIQKATDSSVWSVKDISIASEYENKAYPEEAKKYLLSLKGTEKNSTQEQLNKYCQALDRYGPSCRRHMISELRKSVVLQIQYTHALDNLNFQRSKSKSWQRAYSVDAETEALFESDSFQNAKEAGTSDIEHCKKELSLAIKCDSLRNQLKSAQESMELLAYASAGVLQDIRNMKEFERFGNVTEISPSRIKHLLSPFEIEGLQPESFDNLMQKSQNTTETVADSPVAKEGSLKSTGLLTRLTTQLNRGKRLAFLNSYKEYLLQTDIIMLLDASHYTADLYDQYSDPQFIRPLNFGTRSKGEQHMLFIAILSLAYSINAIVKEKMANTGTETIGVKYSSTSGKEHKNIPLGVFNKNVDDNIKKIQELNAEVLVDLQRKLTKDKHTDKELKITEGKNRIIEFDRWVSGDASDQEAVDFTDMEILHFSQVMLSSFSGTSGNDIFTQWFKKYLDGVSVEKASLILSTLASHSSTDISERYPNSNEELNALGTLEFDNRSTLYEYALRLNVVKVLNRKYKDWVRDLADDDDGHEELADLSSAMEGFKTAVRKNTTPQRLAGITKEIWEARKALMDAFLSHLGAKVNNDEIMVVPIHSWIDKILPELKDDAVKQATARYETNDSSNLISRVNREERGESSSSSSSSSSDGKGKIDKKSTQSSSEEEKVVDDEKTWPRKFFSRAAAGARVLGSGVAGIAAIAGVAVGASSLLFSMAVGPSWSGPTYTQNLADEWVRAVDSSSFNASASMPGANEASTPIPDMGLKQNYQNCKDVMDTFGSLVESNNNPDQPDCYYLKPASFPEGTKARVELTEFGLGVNEEYINEFHQHMSDFIQNTSEKCKVEIGDINNQKLLGDHLEEVKNYLNDIKEGFSLMNDMQYDENTKTNYHYEIPNHISKIVIEFNHVLQNYGKLMNDPKSFTQTQLKERLELFKNPGKVSYSEYFKKSDLPIIIGGKISFESITSTISNNLASSGSTKETPGGLYVNSEFNNIYFEELRRRRMKSTKSESIEEVEKSPKESLKEWMGRSKTWKFHTVVQGGLSILFPLADRNYARSFSQAINHSMQTYLPKVLNWWSNKLPDTAEGETLMGNIKSSFNAGVVLGGTTTRVFVYTPAMYRMLSVAMDVAYGHLGSLNASNPTVVTMGLSVGAIILVAKISSAMNQGWNSQLQLGKQKESIDDSNFKGKMGKLINICFPAMKLLLEPRKCLQYFYIFNHAMRLIYTGVNLFDIVGITAAGLSMINDQVLDSLSKLSLQLMVIRENADGNLTVSASNDKEKQSQADRDNKVSLHDIHNELQKSWSLGNKIVKYMLAKKILFNSNSQELLDSKNLVSLEKEVQHIQKTFELLSTLLNSVTFAFGIADAKYTMARPNIIPTTTTDIKTVLEVKNMAMVSAGIPANPLGLDTPEFWKLVPYYLTFAKPAILGKTLVAVGSLWTVLHEIRDWEILPGKKSLEDSLPEKVFLLKQETITSSSTKWMEKFEHVEATLKKIRETSSTFQNKQTPSTFQNKQNADDQ
jgi:hypothetical protein